jgi:PAS domain S-box-containing protein
MLVDTPNRTQPSILCVDDTPANLFATESIFSGLDLRFITATSGQEAIELCQRHDYAVILMDVMMPGMDGIEAAARIRRQERNGYTPLIFVTAYPLDQMKKLEGYGLGAIDYIQKPVAPEILRSKVKVFLDLQRRQEELRESQLRESRARWEAERLREELERNKEIAEMSASYRLFVDSVKDYAIFLLSTEGKVLTWNPGVKRILGYEKEEIESLYLSSIFTEDDKERNVPAEELRKATIHDRAEDTRWHVRKNGSLFWADGIVVSLRENGELKGFAKLLRDRTEGKLAEEALLVSEERLRLATESNHLGTWDWNLVTGDMSWSDRARALCGIGSGAELRYETLLRSVHPEDRERVEAAIGRAKDPASGGDCSVEYRTVGGGAERWLSLRAKVFFDGVGQPIRMLATCWDITERKRMENELRRSNEDLERFAHLASHDLQEPLRTVATHLQIVERRTGGSLDPETLEHIQFAVDGAQRMRGLVQELIAYSRVGATPLHLKPIDCRKVLDEVLGNLKTAIQETGAIVTWDSLPQVQGDQVQLAQLFQNLLENAIKYRGKEPPRIHFGVVKKEAGWLFCVRDNGIGISPENASRIFQPFVRLHRCAEAAGSGLGLSVCKRIVERHGGEIWVESVPGQGASFYFLLGEAGGSHVPS